MTQNTQTTAERIRNLIFDAIQDSPYGDESIVAAPLGVTIAAEIDRLTAERDGLKAALAASWPNLSAQLSEARAEAARLRPAAEAWEAAEVANAENANRMSLIMDADAYTGAKAIWLAAQKQADIAAARAREAKESKP